ncbi:hypothetical protein SLEP1_g59454 [Rubroshorea leprosula]|uniref:Uncharacterized protein n=1 Tax=Rubroshorea leprosula TaxID=152421 RepID=A0AAV5MSD4_9ROSI|nr:hypothetical protein SLEP1_g59454 [Rubroshorea leprosula]
MSSWKFLPLFTKCDAESEIMPRRACSNYSVFQNMHI